MPTMPSREPTHTNEPPAWGISGAKCFITRKALSRLLCKTSRAACVVHLDQGAAGLQAVVEHDDVHRIEGIRSPLARSATNVSSLRSPGT